MAREVKCAGCKRPIADDIDISVDERQPCEVCGFRQRLMAVGVSLTALWNVEALAVPGKQAGEATVAMAGKPRVDPDPDTIVEFPLLADKSFKVEIGHDESMVWVRVVHSGRTVGWGCAATLVDALLGALPFMLPPDHPDHPPLPDN